MRVKPLYRPVADGRPDPGEVVWAWVPFEDDPTMGKDRPVLLVGTVDGHLAGVPLTSKRPHRGRVVEVGTGPWDPQARVSWAKVDQVLEVPPGAVRRTGAALPERRFRQVLAAAGL